MGERLVLEASVVDKFSQPLKDLKKQLKEMTSPKGIEAMRKDFEKLRKEIGAATKEGVGTFSESLAGVALPAFSAAGAIAAIVKSVKSFAGAGENLDALSRHTKVSIGYIQQLSQVGEAFGVSSDTMGESLKHISTEFGLIQAGAATSIDFLRAKNPELLAYLRSPAATVEESTKKVIAWLETMNKGYERDWWSEKMFGSSGVSAMLDDTALFEQRMKDANERIRNMSPFDVQKAKEFNTSIANLQTSFTSLEQTLGVTFGPDLTEAVKTFDKWIQDSKGGIGDALMTDARDLKAIFQGIQYVIDRWNVNVAKIKAAGTSITSSGYNGFDSTKHELEGIADFFGKLLGVGSAHAGEMPHPGNPYGGLPDRSIFNNPAVTSMRQYREDIAAGTKKGFIEALHELNGAGGGDAGINAGISAEGAHASRRALLGGFGSVKSGEGLGSASVGKMSGDIKERARHYMDRLVKEHGFTPEGAAMMAGQAWKESKFNPGAVGDHGTSRGLHQWHLDREAAMQEYVAAAKAKGINGFDAQIDFAANEVRHRRTALERNISKATDLSQSSSFGHLYEGYAGGTQTDRDAAARRFLGDYKSGSALKASQDAGLNGQGAGPLNGQAKLHITVAGSGNVKTKTDGGSLFTDMPVKRTRPLAEADDGSSNPYGGLSIPSAWRQ
jgi:hypothetical protein